MISQPAGPRFHPQVGHMENTTSRPRLEVGLHALILLEIIKDNHELICFLFFEFNKEPP